eukprot:Em0004g397a
MEGLSEDKDTAAGSEDDLVDRVYLFLKDNAYPKQSSVSLKRQIRLRWYFASRKSYSFVSRVPGLGRSPEGVGVYMEVAGLVAHLVKVMEQVVKVTALSGLSPSAQWSVVGLSPASRVPTYTAMKPPLAPNAHMHIHDLDEHVEDQRMFDCVNVLLKMQNTNGGYASYKTKRGGAILEILNPCFRDCLSRALKYVLSIQKPDGSWEGVLSSPLTTGAGVCTSLMAPGLDWRHRAVWGGGLIWGADYTCEECCVSFKCHYALERHKNTRSHCMFVLALKQPEVSKPSLQPDSALDTDDGITQTGISVPSLKAIRSFKLPGLDLPKRHVSSQGNPFYCQSVVSTLQLCMANPKIASSLTRYPVQTEGAVFAIAYAKSYNRHLKEQWKSVCQNFIDSVKVHFPNLLRRPKMHLILHLIECLEQYGPTSAFSAERCESFNSDVRAQNIHSNRQAPSRDIGKHFAVLEHIRHIIDGGRYGQESVGALTVSVPGMEKCTLFGLAQHDPPYVLSFHHVQLNDKVTTECRVTIATHGENCWKLLDVEPFHGFVVSDYIALFCVNRLTLLDIKTPVRLVLSFTGMKSCDLDACGYVS